MGILFIRVALILILTSKRITNDLTRCLLVTLLSGFFSLSAAAYSNQTGESKSIYETGRLYIAVENQMAEIDKSLATAKNAGKLALIVMGANWCHDSRSIASNLYLPDIKKSIEKNYELLFVDVGYYSNIKKVINRFGMPIIYSTPTVLIIDPESEQLINRHNMLLMRDAASVSGLETLQYFEDIATNRERLTKVAVTNKNSPKLSQLNRSIDDFEELHAKRIYHAFSIIGPLIKEKNQGGDPKEFGKIWKAISKLRYTITDDLARLRDQAKQIAQGSDSKGKIKFPKYPAFDWETEDAL